MYKPFGIVEIGSTNTKAYVCSEKEIIEIGFKTIEFKKNYALAGCIISSDTDALVRYVNGVFDNGIDIYVYATSVFRELKEEDVRRFEQTLKKETSVKSVNIVTAKTENELTVIGAMNNVSLDDDVCVFVGGGGSTEISVCRNGKIIEMVNSDIGVTSIMRTFPDLSENYASTDIETVTKHIYKYLKLPAHKSDYMILAGGDYILRYENAKYPVNKNTLFSSEDHPYIIPTQENRAFEDKYYHKISLNELKGSTPDNPNWWNGTRSMCAFTNAVAVAIDAKIIIPTRISMVYGIASQLREKIYFMYD